MQVTLVFQLSTIHALGATATLAVVKPRFVWPLRRLRLPSASCAPNLSVLSMETAAGLSREVAIITTLNYWPSPQAATPPWIAILLKPAPRTAAKSAPTPALLATAMHAASKRFCVCPRSPRAGAIAPNSPMKPRVLPRTCHASGSPPVVARFRFPKAATRPTPTVPRPQTARRAKRASISPIILVASNPVLRVVQILGFVRLISLHFQS